MNLKSFAKNGNQYKMKQRWGMSIPLVGVFVISTIAGFIKIPESSFKWWMMGISIILLVAILRSYLIIDLDSREIKIKMGLFGGAKIISLDDLQGFTVSKIQYMGLITINVQLLANYIDRNGKEREIPLVQSFFTKSVQYILNEIEEILQNDSHKS